MKNAATRCTPREESGSTPKKKTRRQSFGTNLIVFAVVAIVLAFVGLAVIPAFSRPPLVFSEEVVGEGDGERIKFRTSRWIHIQTHHVNVSEVKIGGQLVNPMDYEIASNGIVEFFSPPPKGKKVSVKYWHREGP